MQFRPYVKAPLAPAAIVTKLQGQGLVFANPATAEALLGRISYFRLRGYLYPYLDLVNSPAPPAPKIYKAGATFEQAVEMYHFDAGLRDLIFGVLPELEVALRSVLDATVSAHAGHSFWYLQHEWFGGPKRLPVGVLNRLSNSFCDSSEKYADHYRQTYYNEHAGVYKGMPPFWVICELSTLGQIKEILEKLKENAPGFPATTFPKSTALDKMAQQRFGAKHFEDFVKWVHMLRDVRNVCAHHGRLWNKNFLAPPQIGHYVTIPFPTVTGQHGGTFSKTNSVYAALVVLRVMCKAVGIDDGIKPGLTHLLAVYPEAGLHMLSMGMPATWDQDTVWI